MGDKPTVPVIETRSGMYTRHEFDQLCHMPYPPWEIEWRVGYAAFKGEDPKKRAEGDVTATLLAYVTGRAIQNRADLLFGKDGWANEILLTPQGVVYGMKVWMNGEWITKFDGSEYTSESETKGGISGGSKRSLVLYGPGRYLYSLPDTWADTLPSRNQGYPNKGSASIYNTQGKVVFYYANPSLPLWARPTRRELTLQITPDQRRLYEGILHDDDPRKVHAALRDTVPIAWTPILDDALAVSAKG